MPAPATLAGQGLGEAEGALTALLNGAAGNDVVARVGMLVKAQRCRACQILQSCWTLTTIREGEVSSRESFVSGTGLTTRSYVLDPAMSCLACWPGCATTGAWSASSWPARGLAGMTGTKLLARVREFHRAAKCLLLIDWGYGPPSEAVLQAIALSHIDAYLARPVTVPPERFHLAVTELLEEWARAHLPRFEVVRV